MTFPNIPPASGETPVATLDEPPVGHPGNAAPPTSPGPDPSENVIFGPNGERAVLLDEHAVVAEVVRESHGLHITMLSIGTIASMALACIGAEGPAVVIGACIGTVIAILFTTPVNAAGAWLVGKMFAHDFGSFPLLLLRVGAVTALFTAGMAVATLAVGPFMSLLLVLPLMLILSVWLIDMDMVQAMVFTAILGSIKMLLTMLLLASLSNVVGMPAPGMFDTDESWETYDDPSWSDEYEPDAADDDEVMEYNGAYSEDWDW